MLLHLIQIVDRKEQKNIQKGVKPHNELLEGGFDNTRYVIFKYFTKAILITFKRLSKVYLAGTISNTYGILLHVLIRFVTD